MDVHMVESMHIGILYKTRRHGCVENGISVYKQEALLIQNLTRKNRWGQRWEECKGDKRARRSNNENDKALIKGPIR